MSNKATGGEPVEGADIPVTPGRLNPHILSHARKVAGRADDEIMLRRAAEEAARAADAANQAARELAKKVNTPARKVVIGAGQTAKRRTGNAFNPLRRRTYLEHLAGGLRRGEAAKLAGVSRSTVNTYRKIDPAFVTMEEEAEGEATERIEDALYQLAESGHLEAMKFVLMNRQPDRWKDPKTLKVTVAGQIDHAHTAEVGPRLERIAALQAKLVERAALGAGQTDDAGLYDVLEADWSDDSGD